MLLREHMFNHCLWNSFDNMERSFLLDVCLNETPSIVEAIAYSLLFGVVL